MIPIKKLKYSNPEKISGDYKEKLCNGVPQRVHKNIREHRNKKLI